MRAADDQPSVNVLLRADPIVHYTIKATVNGHFLPGFIPPHRPGLYGDPPMQPALFRLGAIVATPDFLAAVPRPAMVDAIQHHATDPRSIRDGQPILSAHAYCDLGFSVLTVAERLRTSICLVDECC